MIANSKGSLRNVFGSPNSLTTRLELVLQLAFGIYDRDAAVFREGVPDLLAVTYGDPLHMAQIDILLCGGLYLRGVHSRDTVGIFVPIIVRQAEVLSLQHVVQEFARAFE